MLFEKQFMFMSNVIKYNQKTW